MASQRIIRKKISEGKFHEWTKWRRLSKEVIAEQRGECQECKARGRYSRATLVHHDKAVKDYPELAMSKHWIDEQGVKHVQLIALCHTCHERIEEKRGNRHRFAIRPSIAPERW